MFANRINQTVIFSVMVVLMAGCISLPGPTDWVPSSEEVQQDVYGAWTILEITPKSNKKPMEGELIAVQQGILYLLNENILQEIPIKQIKKAILASFNARGGISMWATLGFVSTLSHGGWLIFSAPIWLISGIINSNAATTSGMLKFDNYNLRDMKKYARFPQGIPEGLDIYSLKPKSQQLEKKSP